MVLLSCCFFFGLNAVERDIVYTVYGCVICECHSLAFIWQGQQGRRNGW